MKRFVTYLYQYDRGVRCRNVGFIKVDMRDYMTRMEIQIRGLDAYHGRASIFFIVSDMESIAVPAGEIAICQGRGSIQMTCPQNLLGKSTYHINDVTAIVLRYGGGKILASCWCDQVPENVVYGKFQVWEEMKEIGIAEVDVIQDEPTVVEPATHTIPETIPTETTDITFTSEYNKQNPMPNNDIPRSEPLGKQNETDSNLQTAINSKESNTNDTNGNETSSTPTYKKIAIADIRSLPKKNWYLSNNSFLIHGFFNYRYLMLKTVESNGAKKYYLGVPGVFEQPEYMMAMLFGFPDFEPAAGNEASSETGVFGYWMTELLR